MARGRHLPSAPAVSRHRRTGRCARGRFPVSITALVVDDEPIARHAIVRLLRDDPDIELLGECGDGASAVEAIRHRSPELVFLDIQMPAMSGMEVASTIGAERMPATVFVTAFEQYAVRAFETNAVDYLVKPFSRERFAATLRRVKSRLSAGAGAGRDASTQILQALQALRQRDEHIQRIPIRTDEHIRFIEVDDIVWIKASGNTVQIHLADGMHEMRETMSALVERLDPRHFARVHRSAIINVRRIKAIHPWFNGYHVVTMDTGQKLRMSRYQHDTFLRLVSARGGNTAE
nr:LytTR family transcriptional regulator DNA-binding domain-containing protein [Rhodanobacter sp. ANJX3]